MSDFVTKLRLAEQAAEDIYFAKVDSQLIESLHARMQAEKNSIQPFDQSSARARAENQSGSHGRGWHWWTASLSKD